MTLQIGVIPTELPPHTERRVSRALRHSEMELSEFLRLSFGLCSAATATSWSIRRRAFGRTARVQRIDAGTNEILKEHITYSRNRFPYKQ
jgi:hypothetical protein